MSRLFARSKQENGQVLVIGALLATALLGLVGLIVDAGLLYAERRQAQNAADQAALAAAVEIRYGGSDEDAIAAALENAAANGYPSNCNDDDDDGDCSVNVTVNMPATQGDYADDDRSIEVIITQTNVPTFFIHALSPSSAVVGGRGVALLRGAGEGIPDGEPFPIVIPRTGCDATATVDGRVLEEDEGYYKVADLMGDTTDYGDAFYACDDSFLYFALRMNGPSTGGGVANENVYDAKCGLKYRDGELDKLYAIVQTVGVDSFTIIVSGVIWTIQVDAATDYRSDIDSFDDIVPGMHVEVRVVTVLGPQSVLVDQVKVKPPFVCGLPGIVDNYQSVFNTGWEFEKHAYNKLLGSDRARFQIACDGVVRHDFIQDYLREVGNEWASDADGNGTVYVAGPNQSASSLEFNLEHPEITGWPYAEIQSPPFDPQYPEIDSQYENFVWEMIYEFRVPRADLTECNQLTFGLNDFGGSTGGLEGMHSSPAKTADGAFLRVEPFDVRLVE